jgi:hypothetical protein
MENIFWIMVMMLLTSGEPSDVKILARENFEGLGILENVPQELKSSLMIFETKNDCEQALLVMASKDTDSAYSKSRSTIQFNSGQAHLKIEVSTKFLDDVQFSEFEHAGSVFCVQTKGPLSVPKD